MILGVWILIGIVSFLICEKLATYGASPEEGEESEVLTRGPSANNNDDKVKINPHESEIPQKHVRIQSLP